TFTLTATDADLPANTFTFSAGDLPAGATLDPTTGVFSWTPAETQGPAVFNGIGFGVSDGPTSVGEAITITVLEVNQAPVLAAIGNKTVNEGTLLTFTATATDGDVPINNRSFSLANGAGGLVPVGALIDNFTGQFTWTPTEAQ